MHKGDRISFAGRNGTVVGLMPGNMIDIRFDDAMQRVERRAADRLSPPVRQNPRPPRARRNTDANAIYAAVLWKVSNDASFRSIVGGASVNDARRFTERNAHLAAQVYEEYLNWARDLEEKSSSREVETLSEEEQAERQDRELAARLEREKPRTAASLSGATRVLRQTERQQRKLTEKAAAARRVPDIGPAIQSSGAGFWTRIDPPRLASDGSYCGNAIDGTAYYIAVMTKSKAAIRWITWDEVITAASLWPRDKKGEVRKDLSSEEMSFVMDKARAFFAETYQGQIEGRAFPQEFNAGALAVQGRQGGERKGRAGGRVRPSGSIPDPVSAFWLPVEGRPGFRTYWRTSASTAPELDKLRDMFQPFSPWSFTLPKEDTAGEALRKALAKKFPGADESRLADAASLLFSAGAVFGSSGFGGKRPLTQGVKLDSGVRMSVSFDAKLNSPYFSWVPSQDAPPSKIGELRDPLACAPAGGRALEEKHQSAEAVLKGVQSAFVSIQSTFRNLGMNPEITSPKLADWKLKALAAKLAGMARWATRLEKTASASQDEEKAMDENREMPTPPSFVQAARALYAAHLESGLFEIPPDEEEPLFNLALGWAKESGMLKTHHHKEWESAFSGPIGNELYENFIESQVAQLGSLPEFAPLVKLLRSKRDSPARVELAAQQALDSFLAPRLKGTPERARLVEALKEVAQEENSAMAEEILTRKVDPVAGLVINQALRESLPSRQRDLAYVTALLFSGPSCVYRRASLELNSAELHELLLKLLVLTWVYFGLRGLELTGPLTGESSDGVLLEAARTSAQAGGTKGIGTASPFSVFKTYNPLLYRLTHLFWPTKRLKQAVWHKGQFLLDPKRLVQVDTIGRYGVAVQTVQEVTLRAESVEDVQGQLVSQLTPSVLGLESNSAEQRVTVIVDRRGQHELFHRLWPVNGGRKEAIAVAKQLANDPLVVIGGLRRELEPFLASVVPLASKSPIEARPPALFPHDSDIPGQLPSDWPKTSALARVEEADGERRALIRAIDEALAKLERR